MGREGRKGREKRRDGVEGEGNGGGKARNNLLHPQFRFSRNVPVLSSGNKNNYNRNETTKLSYTAKSRKVHLFRIFSDYTLSEGALAYSQGAWVSDSSVVRIICVYTRYGLILVSRLDSAKHFLIRPAVYQQYKFVAVFD